MMQIAFLYYDQMRHTEMVSRVVGSTTPVFLIP